MGIKNDGLVKSRKCSLSVIPAKAGIQCSQALMKPLDPVFQRGDDFYECIKNGKKKIDKGPSNKYYYMILSKFL